MRKLTWAGLTNVGMKRTGNEDAFIVAEDLGLYVVCDGMGGHASGEVASEMTTIEVVNFMRRREAGDLTLPYPVEESVSDEEQILANSIQYANDKVYVAGMRDPALEGMGTTVVAIQAYDDYLVLAHVGDSRIYRLRDGRLKQMSRDHSLLNYKIDAGEVTTPEQIKNFKHGNIIVRAIGLKDYVRPETNVTEREPGDLFLLCSDGLTDLVGDWAIENVLTTNYNAMEDACSLLVRMANDRGGKDNITVVLVRVDDTQEEFGYATDEFREEATVPRGIPAMEDTTEPGMKAFESDEEEYAPRSDYKDYDPEVDDRTAPHTPVFMWEDMDDKGGKSPGRRADQVTEDLPSVVIGDDDDLDWEDEQEIADARRQRRENLSMTEPLPSIIVDDD